MANRIPPDRTTNDLIVEGARQNNLKNISLRIPHNQVTAITGLSGSGKSSLAFDTLFAEGQWRYVESLSTYARMFLDKVNRPDVDRITNDRTKKSDPHRPLDGRHGHGTRRPAAPALRQNRQTRVPGLQAGGAGLPPRIGRRGTAGTIPRRTSHDSLSPQGSRPRPRPLPARLTPEARI
ncbi:MAG TPA: hypothetical protein PLT27_12505, partial [Nitrospira sp.]|nr:hypothetical protein [Nitrospira sp.]